MLDSLITASLEAKTSSYLERFPKVVLDESESAAIAWIIGYNRKYHHLPSVERFQTTEHGIYLNKHLSTSPLQDLYEMALEQKRKEFFLAHFHDIEAVIDGDGDLPITDIIHLGRQLSSLSAEEDDSIMSIDRDDLYSEDPPLGLRFGYEVIDKATGGIQAGEYGLLVARTGVGKTLLTCQFALKWAREGKKVLVISCEMPTKQMVGRLDSMIGGFNPNLFRNRENPALLRTKRRQVERELRKIQADGGDIIFPKSRVITVSKLRGMIADRNPDVVIVDGVYLLRSEDANSSSSDWQRLKAASNELKQICLELDIPIFATSQLKRTGKEDGFTLEDIAYSDALGQDTDLVLVANKFAGIANQLTVEVIKNRHGEGYGGTVLKHDWDTMSTTEIEWSDTVGSARSMPVEEFDPASALTHIPAIEDDEEDEIITIGSRSIKMEDIDE